MLKILLWFPCYHEKYGIKQEKYKKDFPAQIINSDDIKKIILSTMTPISLGVLSKASL